MTGDPVTASSPSAAFPVRLNGWKEIAAYFGKGVRTVQRWEKDLGLPVRRLSTGRGEVVYALAAELASWEKAAEKRASLDARPGEDDAEQPTLPPASAAERASRPAPPPRAVPWPWITAGACLLLALAGAAGWRMLAVSSGPPHDARVENQALRVFDQRGRLLWEHRFEFRIRPPAPAVGAVFQWTAVDDLDGDGVPEVLFATVHDETAPSAVFCFDSRGNLRFRHAPRGSVRFGEVPAPGPWVSMTVALGNDPRGRKALWLASSDRDQFPTMIEKIDASGRVLGVFWHAGMVDQLLASTYDGRPVMIAAACHNEANGAVLAVLDNANPTGTSPATLAKFACRGCPPGGPLEYLVFPGGELERLQDNTTGLRRLRRRDDGGYSVDVFHALIPKRFGRTSPDLSGYTSYHLDRRLKPLRAESRPDWRRLLDEAHRLGIMSHPYGPPDEASLWPVLRWNGKGYDELRPRER